MEIRFARGEDVPGIIKLLRQVGRVHHEGRPDLFRVNAQKYGPSQVLDMLGKQPIFVAVEDGVVLGYGFCVFEQFQDHSVMTLFLFNKVIYRISAFFLHYQTGHCFKSYFSKR